MSGRGDSNSRPLRPERSALTGLRYAPKYLLIKNKLLLVELQSLTLKIGRLFQLTLLNFMRSILRLRTNELSNFFCLHQSQTLSYI